MKARRAAASSSALPPGQRAIDFFPRFGRRPGRPPPAVSDNPTVVLGGAVSPPIELGVGELVSLPRREVVADFHCVTGWSVTDLRWEGVPFAVLLERVIAPSLGPSVQITHVDVRGLDGEHFVAELGDLVAGDVLLADRLGGEPLTATHGAPLRLVCPAQYGYASIKHVCAIDVYASEPRRHAEPLVARLLASHPRARVWQEERHLWLPGRVVRPIYRAIQTVLLAPARRRARRHGSPSS